MEENYWHGWGIQSAEIGYWVYTQRTMLTLQRFAWQCLWPIHKGNNAYLHCGCTACVRACVRGAQLNVWRAYVSGLHCIDSTEVTRTMLFALAPPSPLCLTHLFLFHFSSPALTSSPPWIIKAAACFRAQLKTSDRVGVRWTLESYKYFCNALRMKSMDMDTAPIHCSWNGPTTAAEWLQAELWEKEKKRHYSVHSSHIYVFIHFDGSTAFHE